MNNNLTKLLVLGMVLVAAFLVGGSYLYSKVSKNPLSSTPPTLSQQKTDELQPGLKAAQKMFTDYPQFVKSTFIQQQIEGTLKENTENRWTLQTEGKTLTIVNQGATKIRYTKIASGSAQATLPTEIKPTELKAGDLVTINQMIDWRTGKITVLGVTVLPSR